MTDRDFVVNIPCPEVSALLQKKAFQAGYRWADGTTEIHATDEKLLLFSTSKKIFFNPGPSKTRVSIEEALLHFVFPFKVGDWLYCKNSCCNDTNHKHYKIPTKAGDVFQITNIIDSHLKTEKVAVSSDGRVVFLTGYTDRIRLATPEEIEPPFVIGPHQVTFTRVSAVVGCLEREHHSWIKLNEVMDTFNLKKVQHQDGTLATKEDIQKICNRINKLK